MSPHQKNGKTNEIFVSIGIDVGRRDRSAVLESYKYICFDFSKILREELKQISYSSFRRFNDIEIIQSRYRASLKSLGGD